MSRDSTDLLSRLRAQHRAALAASADAPHADPVALARRVLRLRATRDPAGDTPPRDPAWDVLLELYCATQRIATDPPGRAAQVRAIAIATGGDEARDTVLQLTLATLDMVDALLRHAAAALPDGGLALLAE